MLRVVLGSGDVSASELPREDLALCDDPGRVARQVILPKCDTRGILEHTSEGAPGPVRIPWVDIEEAHQEGSAARALGAGTTGGATDPPGLKVEMQLPLEP
ncbi:hypothetical protein E2562_029422 [Oryza meyeriana var. granulata]|uniref:Uncharacterized protein n=1 Tax=Oryza meyeriana var. granulata TaxID=110450 RepID=A0A6G1DQ15_9ORYZ|nr:hypothetical protein E2562_029422 [Oryza meyeriana var. granulata]